MMAMLIFLGQKNSFLLPLRCTLFKSINGVGNEKDHVILVLTHWYFF